MLSHSCIRLFMQDRCFRARRKSIDIVKERACGARDWMPLDMITITNDIT